MQGIVHEASVRWKVGKARSTATVDTKRGILKPAEFKLTMAQEKYAEAGAAELIAAAHAISFCVALSHELRFRPAVTGEIAVTAVTTVARTVAGLTITHIHLDVFARLPAVTQGRFIDVAIRAKKNCIVSRSLRANVSMNAKLEA